MAIQSHVDISEEYLLFLFRSKIQTNANKITFFPVGINSCQHRHVNSVFGLSLQQ